MDRRKQLLVHMEQIGAQLRVVIHNGEQQRLVDAESFQLQSRFFIKRGAQCVRVQLIDYGEQRLVDIEPIRFQLRVVIDRGEQCHFL